MKKKSGLAIAALVVAGSTTGFVLANSSDDGVAGSGMPVPGFEGSVEETIVEGVSSSGMPVPGFEGSVEETIVEGVSSSGMPVPGFEGQIDDTVVEVSP